MATLVDEIAGRTLQMAKELRARREATDLRHRRGISGTEHLQDLAGRIELRGGSSLVQQLRDSVRSAITEGSSGAQPPQVRKPARSVGGHAHGCSKPSCGINDPQHHVPHRYSIRPRCAGTTGA